MTGAARQLLIEDVSLMREPGVVEARFFLRRNFLLRPALRCWEADQCPRRNRGQLRRQKQQRRGKREP